jgi:Ca-activated chloride channel family protein
MSFIRPGLLWLLLGVAALAATYVYLQQRRRHYAVRFTNLPLLESVAPKRPGWRRHVPAAAVALALIASVIGLARPVRATAVPRATAVVMLALDISGSMAATDVSPDRLDAAVTAAATFVKTLPAGFEVGLVAFDDMALVVATPTTDHDSVVAALKTLQPGRGTAAGDGIMAALQAIETAQAAASAKGQTAADAPPATVPSATVPSATIVLLSDGATTTGLPVEQAAHAAKDANVPVSTITYGTDGGTVDIQGQVIPVPPDPDTMAAVAKATGGTAFNASSTSQLNSVYSEIQGRVGYTAVQHELIVWFLGAAMILLVLGCAGSMLWTGRFL